MSILFPRGSVVVDRKYHEAGLRGLYEKNLRLLRGTIDTTGPTILSGVGFSVAKDATGDVRLTFERPFSAPPSVTYAAIAATPVAVRLTEEATESSVHFVRFTTTTGAAVDGLFGFQATGPA